MRGNFFRILLLAAPVVLLAARAEAFCIKNEAAVAVHARALDGSDFATDIDPGQKVCLDDRKNDVPLLVATGYVPVGNDQRPGWRSECRAKVKDAEWLVTGGTLDKVTCQVQATAPE